MVFFKNIRRIFTPAPRRRSSAPPAFDGLGPRNGQAPLWLYSAQGAKCVSTVYACAKLLSDAVANLSMEYMRRDDQGVFRQDHSDRLWYLLNVQPTPWMSAFDYRARLVDDMLFWGNAYIVPVINPEIGDYTMLPLVRPWCVTIDTETDIYTIEDTEAGISGTFKAEEVIHIKGMGDNPKLGMSVLSYARTSIDIGRSGDIEAKDRMVNGGQVKGVLSNDRTAKGVGKYQDEALQFVAIEMDSKFAAGQRIVHVPGTVEFKQLSMSSADMQFLESRKFAVEDICRFFGVNPSFVTGQGNSAYKSASESVNMFMLTTLNPLLRKIENEFTRKLVSEKHAYYRKIEFDRNGIYGCDPEGRIRHMAAMQSVGALTVNEIRTELGRAPIQGGDRCLVSANLRDINESNQPASNDESK